jgi:hypothetical protein
MNCCPFQGMFLFLCEHDYRGTTNMMGHPYISAGTSHGIRMNDLPAGGLVMAVH